MGLRGNKKSNQPRLDHEHCLLLIEIPRTNDKKELSAEQMLAALHGILRQKGELKLSGKLQEHFSLEIAAIGQRIRFYIWTPKHLRTFVEGQVYAQYPAAQIFEQSTDYSQRSLTQSVICTTELTLTDNEALPIKTFPSFEVDPLAAITATLAKLDQQDEEIWVQILCRPISDDWHKRGAKMVERIKSGKGSFGGGFGGATLNYAGQLFTALVKPPEPYTGTSGEVQISERDKSRISAIEEKGNKLGYQVKIRIIYAGQDAQTANHRLQAMVGAFKQFNTTNLNGFKIKSTSYDRDKQIEYQARFFIDHGFILNIEELASIFHLPHTTVETPNIVWATTKTAEPPSNIPVQIPGQEHDISLFGATNFRGDNTIFGMYRSDRGRHIYILGQTGTGKSGALELLTLSDVYYDEGFAIVDPHGDYAQHVMRFIPERRVDDIVYFNPADTDYPIGFNPLELTDPTLKNHISSELVGVMKRMFESWGPRLEYILRYTLLALLDYPNSTMLDITRMLTEKKFRQKVIEHIDDPVVKNFWVTEFGSWNDKFATEAVAPVLNKVGAFTANPMIRNIIGQPKSNFNIRQIMDQGKILIVNLSRGLVGEDNAAILGAMMVTKIQLAAMSRADVDESMRRPFYLYVDEFQNFATDSFAVILSEARKYGLNLTVANQYINQMSEPVRNAVFGNVGTIICFRVSPDDAPFLQNYFAPFFEANDLIQQHNRHFVATMTISGEKAPAFSAMTLDLPTPPGDMTKQIVELSRQRYASKRHEVEDLIRKISMDEPQQVPVAKNDQNGSRSKQPSGNESKINKAAEVVVKAQVEAPVKSKPNVDPKSIARVATKGINNKPEPQKSNKTDNNKQTEAKPVEKTANKPQKESKPKRRRNRNRRRKPIAQPITPNNEVSSVPSNQDTLEHEQIIKLR